MVVAFRKEVCVIIRHDHQIESPCRWPKFQLLMQRAHSGSLLHEVPPVCINRLPRLPDCRLVPSQRERGMQLGKVALRMQRVWLMQQHSLP